MPVTFLSHPQHGKTTATAYEIPELLKNGWKIDEPKKKVKSEEPSIQVNIYKTLEEKYEEKFGKLPHHRMKQETIEAALKE